jgi:two-component system, NtrC family, response regulator AtoC
VEDRQVLIIETDAVFQAVLIGAVQTRGYSYRLASSADEALVALAQHDFLFTLVNTHLDGGDRQGLVRSLRMQGGDPGPLIGFAWDSDDRGDIEATSLALDGFLRAPFTQEALEGAIGEVARRPGVAARQNHHDEPAATRQNHRDEPAATVREEMTLWRASPKMREVLEIIREAAGVDVTLLITGETGTGKDLAARAIHCLSGRRRGPFVKVNCAAVPRELLESELFGHERGAFTGAHKLKVGKFEAAHRGTIFLDEIGDLHSALQAKLLHVLQDGDFSRVGGKSTLKVDVRVLAATNQALEQAVAEGRFREDLYYRLNVIQIAVPPLRERVEEIPLLVDYFVRRYSRIFHREGFSISPAVMERLTRHPYPGNVRELENLIKRMIVLRDPLLTRTPVPHASTDLGGNGASPAPVPEVSLKDISRKASLVAEREAISTALEQTGWNRVRAAKALKISYRALLYKIKRVGLENHRPSSRSATPSQGDRPGGLVL